MQRKNQSKSNGRGYVPSLENAQLEYCDNFGSGRGKSKGDGNRYGCGGYSLDIKNGSGYGNEACSGSGYGCASGAGYGGESSGSGCGEPQQRKSDEQSK